MTRPCIIAAKHQEFWPAGFWGIFMLRSGSQAGAKPMETQCSISGLGWTGPESFVVAAGEDDEGAIAGSAKSEMVTRSGSLHKSVGTADGMKA